MAFYLPIRDPTGHVPKERTQMGSLLGFPGDAVVKNPPANAEDMG